jgi:hypothetical protein
VTGRKPLTERIRERALAIHRRHCEDGSCGGGPTREEWEQATQEVMRSDGNEAK